MAINIKELFVTDLDPNNGAWWSKSKIDKINYNFNQFLNGGAPGPQGFIGADGGDGPIGAQGHNGYKGPQGARGPQGAGNLNEWVYFKEAEGLPGYLFTRKNPITETQAAPVALRIGYLEQTLDPEYKVGVDPTNKTSIQCVKVANSSWANLRVEDNGGFNGYNFKFGSSSGAARFNITPDLSGTEFRIIYVAQTIILKTGSSDNTLVDSITITDDLITINNGGITGPVFNVGESGGIIKSSTDFIYTTGASTNKILVAKDSNGTVEWKNIKDVFGVYPIGSIISIRATEFITEHFWLNDSVTVTTGSPLNNIYGRGKVDTDFEGWYLCNGETWETVEGYNQFLTPNLNNFSYTISANGDAQNLITRPEENPTLIGGYPLRVSGVPASNGIYSIAYSSQFYDNNTSPGNSDISMGTIGFPSVGYRISGMIHIVYLGNPNLKWSNDGTNAPPPPPPNTGSTIALTLPSSLVLCDEPVNTNYTWTGSSWNTFTVPSTTVKLFNFGTTAHAPSGWYINIDGYPIRWNSITGNFTERGTTCDTITPPTAGYNFKSSPLVDELNGPLSSLTADVYLDYNAPLFINATTLKWSDDQTVYPVGSNAPLGWYRDKITGVRRFWSGTIFSGVSFTENYVSRVTVDYAGQYDPGYNSSTQLSPSWLDPIPPSVCDYFQTSHLTYVAGNDVLTVGNNISQVENIRLYDSPLYVTRLWVQPLTNINGEPDYTPALINIKDQNQPGSTTLKYKKVYMDTYDPGNSAYEEYGNISTTTFSSTGKITTVGSC